ncbi:MAG: PHP domain-containing protein, partial [Acidimicrobiia bacterium]|nr:PHP domain-containing protein [Acidimicrobiia bacterium]
MTRYAELHCHTNYSFLDGASHPHQLVEVAAELGYTALGICDHDGFRGVVRTHVAAREVGLPIVYGTELGMPREDTMPSESPIPGPGPVILPKDADRPRRGRIHRMHGSKPVDRPITDHLVVYAADPAGYAQLSRFVTRGQFRGRKDAPDYAYEDLGEASHRGGLYALTGCHQGAVPRAAGSGDIDGAVGAASRLREVFPGRLYVELTHHGLPEDDLRNDVLAEVARRL